jgi:nucleosome binding factor SPN SPT16 subunit
MDSTVNLDNARRSNFDPDEIEEEVRDKRLRKKMNEAFKDFAAKVSQLNSNCNHLALHCMQHEAYCHNS